MLARGTINDTISDVATVNVDLFKRHLLLSQDETNKDASINYQFHWYICCFGLQGALTELKTSLKLMHIAYQIDQGAPHNKLYLMWVCELLTDQQKLVDAQHLPCAVGICLGQRSVTSKRFVCVLICDNQSMIELIFNGSKSSEKRVQSKDDLDIEKSC